jgi:propanediol utilization protein
MKTRIPVEISARHVHLSKEDFEKLFGENKILVPIKELSQPGEFVSEETVTLVNGERKIENVKILGPLRKCSQVEISLTDAYNLKLNPLPKMKISGDLADTTKILIRGLKSSVKIPCIIAQRHLHCSLKEAEKLKIENNQKISVIIKGIREIIFCNVIARVSDNYRLALHLDTDEGNSAGICGKAFGEIV